MKKLKKLVGIKKTDFDLYMKNHEGILPIQIYVRLREFQRLYLLMGREQIKSPNKQRRCLMHTGNQLNLRKSVMN